MPKQGKLVNTAIAFDWLHTIDTLTIDLVRSGRLDMGGGGGALSSLDTSSFTELSVICKLCCVDDSLTAGCNICPLWCDSESVGVLLGVLLLTWLNDEAVHKWHANANVGIINLIASQGNFASHVWLCAFAMQWIWNVGSSLHTRICCGCRSRCVNHILWAGPLFATVFKPI